MELTPQLFRDVEFTERRGAYDKDEVHAFLARVGTAVGQMQERVREAQRRVEAAEEQVARARSVASEQQDANETIQRTITMAARAAEEEIKDAKAQGEAIVAQARNKADDMIIQAEEAVRRDVGATRDKLQAEIRDLEGHRDELRQRIEVISDHLESERARLHGELDALKAIVDDPSRLRVEPVPGTEPEPVIVLSDEPRHLVETAAVDADVRTPDSGDESPAPDSPAADSPADDDLSHLPPPPVAWSGASSTEPGVVDASEPEPAQAFDADSAGSLFEPIPDEPRPEASDWDGGPPTEATPVIGAGSAFGGSHLDELRRAVSEEADDPEADAAMAAFFDQDNEEERARRFGRRR